MKNFSNGRMRGWDAAVMAAVLLLGLAPAAGAQDLPEPSQAIKPPPEHKKWKLTPEQRRDHEIHVKEWGKLLEESHQGKRDDADRYVILERLLMHWGILQMPEDAPEVRSALKEWRELLAAHPEFKTTPPKEIREHRDRREKHESKARWRSEKMKTWIPPDLRPSLIFRRRPYAAVVYQYRIDFYRLVRSETVEKTDDMYGGNNLVIRRGADVIEKSPNNAISFADIIHVAPRDQADAPALLVCTDPIIGYEPRGDDKKVFGGRRYHWRRPNSTYDQFCGVIGIDGRVWGQIKVTQNPPDAYLQPLGITSNGEEALVGIGRRDEAEEDGVPGVWKYEELVVWKFPNQTTRVRVADLTEAQLSGYCAKFRLAAIPH